ncbi:uncharacterized protein C16orf95 homolog isoform X7 [Oryctolagus cuniculus]|uniref:uncharacterized protein C16orf95 homolog isoform X7 n=1 Tax=Oryctolagus cuniculus TaxID=9986 RepID=UPI00387963EB
MAGPPTRTQVEFLLPRRTPERAQADRPHDITGSLLCPQHSSSTGRRAPTRAPRAQGTGSGQRVPGKTARGCRRARGLAERATPSRLRGAGDSKGADDSSDPTRKSGQRGRLGRPAAAPARSLEMSQRTVRFHVPKASESCPCLCHCVRGRLPVPRSQAMMPYWVPQVLRSPKKTVKRQRSFRGLQGASLNGCPYFSSLLRGFRLCSCVISQLRLLHEPAPLPGPTCLASGSGTLTGTGLTCKWRNVSAGQNAEPDVARKKPSPGEVGWTPAQSLLSGTWVTPTVPRLNGKTRDSLFM